MTQPIFRQDMPPPGGYASIPYKRVPIKSPFNGAAIFAAYAGITALGIYWMKQKNKELYIKRVETSDVNIALEPLLFAERDRLYLLQLLKNRDEEKKLMKNVPGWEVGKGFNGEPIYKSIPEDYYIKPCLNEYYAHASDYQMKKSHFYSFIFG